MKYFGLVWKNVWRKKARTLLTILSVFIAFLLFATLNGVSYAFRLGVDMADPERMVVTNNMSFINPLPIRYQAQIAAVPGVLGVTHLSWFGGYYQDPRLQFAQFPTEPRAYFDMYPELEMPEEQFEAWTRNRIGMVAGREIVEQYGWAVGDRIPLQSTIWTNKDGERTWEFVLEGVFGTDDPRGNTAYVLFHYDYFEEARAFGQGTVGWYVLLIAPDADPAAVANAIDDRFANSPSQTETSTEAAFAESFAKQFGNIGLIVTMVLTLVFFTLLLVSGSTMSQSVRERIPEIAVLKTLGFSDGSVLAIVLSESVLIMLIGGLAGLGIGWLLVQGMADAMAAFLPGIFLSPQAALGALALMIAAGVAAGALPALKARGMTIAAALARG
ncbi:MAG TPA: ABC transporter permease [Woeseiaceae bacterium]|nr:ABC transporter permease [Woeseiaceae bacterium]